MFINGSPEQKKREKKRMKLIIFRVIKRRRSNQRIIISIPIMTNTRWSSTEILFSTDHYSTDFCYSLRIHQQEICWGWGEKKNSRYTDPYVSPVEKNARDKMMIYSADDGEFYFIHHHRIHSPPVEILSPLSVFYESDPLVSNSFMHAYHVRLCISRVRTF